MLNTSINEMKVKVAEQQKVVDAALSVPFEKGNFRVRKYDIRPWGSTRFVHKDDENVEFELSMRNDKEPTLRNLSWSSWSWSSLEKDEINAVLNKGRDYLIRQTEKIEFLLNNEHLSVIEEIKVHWEANVKPELEKLILMKRELEILEKIEEEHKQKDKMKEALDFFQSKVGEEIRTRLAYYYSARNYSYYMKVLAVEKGKVKIRFSTFEEDRAKHLKEEDILSLYKFLSGTLIQASYNYETAEYEYSKGEIILTDENETMIPATEQEYINRVKY